MTKEEEKEVCESKVSYESKRDAQTKLNYMNRSGHRGKRAMRPYHCEWCNQWHLCSKISKGGSKPIPLLHPEMFKELINKQEI